MILKGYKDRNIKLKQSILFNKLIISHINTVFN